MRTNSVQTEVPHNCSLPYCGVSASLFPVRLIVVVFSTVVHNISIQCRASEPGQSIKCRVLTFATLIIVHATSSRQQQWPPWKIKSSHSQAARQESVWQHQRYKQVVEQFWRSRINVKSHSKLPQRRLKKSEEKSASLSLTREIGSRSKTGLKRLWKSLVDWMVRPTLLVSLGQVRERRRSRSSMTMRNGTLFWV